MSFWTNKRVLVTGGAGFLGSHVVDLLRGTEGASLQIDIPRSEDFDLINWEDTDSLFNKIKPDIVIHLAASVGGIGANQANPGKFFYENLMMGAHVLEACRLYEVSKVLCVGTVCSYPKITDVPFKEKDLWAGYPEETNAPYGIAKKALLVQCQAYREQYGLNAIYVIPTNLYGPRDNFDSDTSHVIPALIKKCLDAKNTDIRKKEAIQCWGSGKPTREFLYVEDCAKGILKAVELYNGSWPINLGTGQEISINDLFIRICQRVGHPGNVRWNTSKPDGQPRRCLDTTLAKALFGWKAKTSLDEGLKKTIEWYTTSVSQVKA